MDDKKLVLYLDADYILPVVVNGTDNFLRHRSDDEDDMDLFWLYFFTDPSGAVDSHRRYRSAYQSSTPGYEGAFWEMVMQNPSRACALLQSAGVLDALRRLYGRDVDIPTCYVFAGNIGDESRRSFISQMQQLGFRSQSYSVSLEELAICYHQSLYPERTPGFGQRTVCFASSGSDLVCSTYAFDGISAMPTEAPMVMDNDGENPVYAALVNYVIDTVEQQFNYLRDDSERHREFVHQMQNAPEWMKKAEAEIKRGNTSAFAIAYRYQRDPNRPLQVMVSIGMLLDRQSNVTGELLRKLHKYRDSHSGADFSGAMLLGSAFASDAFAEKVIANIGDKDSVTRYLVEVFPYILNKYPLLAPAEEQTPEEFDEVARSRRNEYRQMELWLQNAANLRQIEDNASSSSASARTAFSNYSAETERALKLSLEQLEQPGGLFNQARGPLLNPTVSQNGQVAAATESYNRLVEEINRSRQMLDQINTFQGARTLISSINDNLEFIQGLLLKYQAEQQQLRDRLSEIDRLEKAYPQYRRLLDEFEDADPQRKVAIIKEIEEGSLTLEPLPKIGLDEPFRATLKADIEVKKTGFLGMTKKKRLVVDVEIAPGYSTECDTVLLVQDIPLSKVEKRYVRCEIPRGTTGTRHIEIELPVPNCRATADKLYVYLRPAPTEAVSINSFTEFSQKVNV